MHLRTVGDIAATLPGATAIFRRFRLDFCCRGNVPLDEAARARGVDTAEVVRALDGLASVPEAAPAPQDTALLIHHILSRYHDVHRRELPELIRLSRKVESVHADHPRVPHGLADALTEVQAELEAHMCKEETILFPAMQQPLADWLSGPIAQMRHEHNDHGAQLRRLEELTGDFELPEGACRSWQALYLGAAKLVHDLMEHIHLENNVLFPRYEQP
ncbi:iron-sulfur cluster repair protein YtfE [Sinimarinibacterium sp. CAU 1509]|uniref:iron-sulfur cluster repair protein YtfE n=1 Tax=Sinimarinibacterium sp. CAU 1509 TaxID=2562283 RepID=UPI00200B41E9|nr:iron-sulfur cluster repair protein YtfE [Sinimarinibacterium sp. CAU 1509]